MHFAGRGCKRREFLIIRVVLVFQDNFPYLCTSSVLSRNIRPLLVSFKVRETKMLAIRL